ncbi:MAG: (deoxy)nucleoside triphosphate pyrophosphohydrolase [Sphingomonas sp.]|uniref:(deoxy)nucleoside triphosphate pyrophosphohydrolase n=1 Tax=Sphingomonas sp. TaxID=28214 RepID=UPI0017AA8C32|nr:(deoxy)nucleoside triphosphate pyrophosphohydrolase [Sphingomonas sp.]
MLKADGGIVSRIPLLVVAIAMVDADGRVLLAQRPAGKQHAGLWEFPGGKVDSSETPEAALIREVAEELGVSISAACIAPATFASVTLAERSLVLLLYVCRKWQGVPRAIEAAALRWVRPVDMYAFSMPPADRSMIGLIEALL